MTELLRRIKMFFHHSQVRAELEEEMHQIGRAHV